MKSAEGSRLRLADLEVDLQHRTVRRAGRRLPVRGRSFQLLEQLIRRHPEISGHRELMEEVWKGRVVTTDALTQRVRLLRKALSDEAGDDGYIESIHGQGYRLRQSPVPGSDEVRAVPAHPRRGLWLGLALSAGLVVVLWMVLGNPHAIKHFFKHIFGA